MSDPLFDLAGRVAVVTGGMGQLGSELAVALAGRGMRVAILDLETEPRETAAAAFSAMAAASPMAIVRHVCIGLPAPPSTR